MWVGERCTSVSWVWNYHDLEDARRWKVVEIYEQNSCNRNAISKTRKSQKP